ncbi:uroporphyrinogen-III C-methyltransferase [Brevundimonas vitis]|uniref:Uroporphyrinogen-III C-methyltransferase n=1 Tax=Brevundimonas vitisensis TaxID=2800818 RepID=A0ABX7BQ69_9CAUL|nr:siroheme synthase CysG [Brevundimonas vitisensis]QQQ19749.1 uroporphyrinogen-III C-methyltransferase [Brevundimonas vitisensis]
MRLFLASIPLEDTRVVVVGGGEPALAKLRLFLGSPAQLSWFAPELDASALEIPRTAPKPQRREPSAADLDGARLVFIALPDLEQVGRIAALARAAGAQVNVVDQPALSDFQTPALIDRDEVVVGIATGGSAPILARDIRSRIEAVLPEGLAHVARMARELRDTVKSSVPDFMARRRFWERAFRGPAADLAAAGRTAEARREMLRLLNQAAPEQGMVHIVGAGPGDPELLTLKALRALQDADVIIHDRLVPDAVLDRARRDARRLYVGKTRGDHSVPQDQIEQLMIDEARAGHRVVRLKGGDPFVFGRGGEELASVRAAGIPVFVVPGVTAALACAASAGIPLTHRDHAQAVTFVTAQAKPGGTDADWARLAGPNHTLAIYMGTDRAAETAAALMAAGRTGSTPVAVVENGSRPDERILHGRLDGLAALVRGANLTGPALLFVGETAAFSLAEPAAEVAA